MNMKWNNPDDIAYVTFTYVVVPIIKRDEEKKRKTQCIRGHFFVRIDIFKNWSEGEKSNPGLNN